MFDNNKTYFNHKLTAVDAQIILNELEEAIIDNDVPRITNKFDMIKKHMKLRVDENYFQPAKSFIKYLKMKDRPENISFILMSIDCILIEFYYELINGIGMSSDKGSVRKAYDEILPLMDANITNKESGRFYRGIRCGIVHQGQTKERTALVHDTPFKCIFVKSDDSYISNSEDVFHSLEELYSSYWKIVSEKRWNTDEADHLIKKYKSILNENNL